MNLLLLLTSSTNNPSSLTNVWIIIRSLPLLHPYPSDNIPRNYSIPITFTFLQSANKSKSHYDNFILMKTLPYPAPVQVQDQKQFKFAFFMNKLRSLLTLMCVPVIEGYFEGMSAWLSEYCFIYPNGGRSDRKQDISSFATQYINQVPRKDAIEFSEIHMKKE